MKRKDIIFIVACVIFFCPFFISKDLYEAYKSFNQMHFMIMSFIKFAILATLGEVIGLRIRTGNYNESNFGIIPRAIVWGLLGLTIKMAFTIFGTGTLAFIKSLGFEHFKAANLPEILKGSMCVTKIGLALCISLALNLIYAPILMTLHKITDTHIMDNGGSIASLVRPIKFGEIFVKINWNVMWNFVYKKTIPLFWIPAHTITFLLPVEWQVLYAAVLGIFLGVFLSIASVMSRKK